MKAYLNYFLFFSASLTLALWFQNCSQLSSSGNQTENMPAALEVSHPDPAPNLEKTATGITLIDRVGVTSVLENVFLSGLSSEADRNTFFDLINAEIRPQQHAFGRPCDIVAQGTFADCFYNLTNLEMGMWKSTSTVRESSRIQLCRRLVATDSLLNSAVNQVKGQDLTPNVTSLQKTVQLFYPAWEAESITNVVQALVTIDNKMAVNSETMLDRWRLVFLSVCETAYWEIL
ncbi:MAG: hypothetical protein J0M15_04485 [Deltaproteobacteria bacterium]|nr:hypothetical protein [Deltaproteobacteria bacterium]